jgi:CHASE2 domain-containing sensor protein
MHIAVALAAGLLALIAYESGALNAPERTTVDARFGIRGAESPDGRIVIVALDPNSVSALNEQLPISRARYAALLDRVRAADPRVIAVDTQFTGKVKHDPGGDRALLASVERNGPVLLATHENAAGRPVPVPAGRKDAPGAVEASAGVQNDPDNVFRRMLFAPVALKTFAVRAAELYTGRPVDESDFPGNHAWIAFRGPPGTFETVSFYDVLKGRVPAATFAGKAVLVGATDPSAKDIFVTSASDLPMPGVEFQANALSTILDGFPLQPVSGGLTVLLLFALAAVPALVNARFSVLAMLLTSLCVFLLLLVGAQLAFNSGWIVPVLAPTLAILLAAIGCVAADAFFEGRRRSALQAALGRLMPPPSPRAFFISYRRHENAWAAGMLRDELVERFGSNSVFMDTASLYAGQQWPRRIQDALRGCSVMLALIGESWMARDGASGARRIDDPRDWVRREIEAVLRRPDAIVVPVVLDGAAMPTSDELPQSLRALAYRQAARLTVNSLAADIDALIESIEEVGSTTTSPRSRPVSKASCSTTETSHAIHPYPSGPCRRGRKIRREAPDRRPCRHSAGARGLGVRIRRRLGPDDGCGRGTPRLRPAVSAGRSGRRGHCRGTPRMRPALPAGRSARRHRQSRLSGGRLGQVRAVSGGRMRRDPHRQRRRA